MSATGTIRMFPEDAYGAYRAAAAPRQAIRIALLYGAIESNESDDGVTGGPHVALAHWSTVHGVMRGELGEQASFPGTFVLASLHSQDVSPEAESSPGVRLCTRL